MVRHPTTAVAEDGIGPFFTAGQTVPAGAYLELTSHREVRLDQNDVLPATCNGQAAVYVRKPLMWGECRSGNCQSEQGHHGHSA